MSDLTSAELNVLSHVMGEPMIERDFLQSPYAGGSPIARTQFPKLQPANDPQTVPFDHLKEVTVDIEVVLGKTRLTLEKLLELRLGQVIPLDKLAGEPVDIEANGKVIAKGEVVAVGHQFGVKITSKPS